MRRLLLALASVLVLFPGLVVAKKSSGIEGSEVYLKQNLQVSRGRGYSTYFSSIPDADLIPAGSKVTILKVGGKGFVLETGEGKIKFEYQPRWYDMSTEEFLERITSSGNPKGAWADFSSVDKQGIKEGKIKVGMSRAAVLVAAGYPPATKTPDAKSDTWVYQRNRFAWVTLKFTGNKVSAFGSER
jgi:hypothetical protein